MGPFMGKVHDAKSMGQPAPSDGPCPKTDIRRIGGGHHGAMQIVDMFNSQAVRKGDSKAVDGEVDASGDEA